MIARGTAEQHRIGPGGGIQHVEVRGPAMRLDGSGLVVISRSVVDLYLIQSELRHHECRHLVGLLFTVTRSCQLCNIGSDRVVAGDQLSRTAGKYLAAGNSRSVEHEPESDWLSVDMGIKREVFEPGQNVRLKVAWFASKNKSDQFENAGFTSKIVCSDDGDTEGEIEGRIELAGFHISALIPADPQPIKPNAAMAAPIHGQTEAIVTEGLLDDFSCAGS